MAKMTVLYKTPKDIEAFEKHYFEVHVPLAKKMPGLIRYEVNDGNINAITGHIIPYRIANLYFENMDSMMNAFKSEIGQLCAADRKLLADDEHVQIYFYETISI